MQVRILDEKVSVYSAADVTSEVVAELSLGDEVKLGKTVRDGGPVWIPVVLSGGETGYVAGYVDVFKMIQINLNRSFNVFDSTTTDSNVKMTLNEGDPVTLRGVVQEGDTRWVEVLSESGEIGYLPQDEVVTGETLGELTGTVGGFGARMAPQDVVRIVVIAGAALVPVGLIYTLALTGLARSIDQGGVWVPIGIVILAGLSLLGIVALCIQLTTVNLNALRMASYILIPSLVILSVWLLISFDEALASLVMIGVTAVVLAGIALFILVFDAINNR